MMNNKRPKFLRLLTTFALAAAVALIALYSVYMIWERPPEQDESPLGAKSLTPPTETPAQTAAPEPTQTAELSPPALSPAPTHPYEPLPVYVDGLLTMRGYLRGGAPYLPPEAVCVYYGIGFETSWDSSGFTLRLPGLDVDGRDGEPYITADGRYLYAPDGWFQADGLLYLPADAVERLFGVTVTLAEDGSRADLSGTGYRLLRGGEDYYTRTTQADDLYWLIHIIYSEAHHESLAGQIGVGNVVLNRVASDDFPATIMAVVLDREHTLQFSPVGTCISSIPSAAIRPGLRVR